MVVVAIVPAPSPTCKLNSGAVVPIPTLPAAVIRITSVGVNASPSVFEAALSAKNLIFPFNPPFVPLIAIPAAPKFPVTPTLYPLAPVFP